MASPSLWKGRDSGKFTFGVVLEKDGAKSETPKEMCLTELRGKPIVIHFYSDG